MVLEEQFEINVYLTQRWPSSAWQPSLSVEVQQGGDQDTEDVNNQQDGEDIAGDARTGWQGGQTNNHRDGACQDNRQVG